MTNSTSNVGDASSTVTDWQAAALNWAAAIHRAGVAAVELADAYRRIAEAMQLDPAWEALFKLNARRYPWYNRLRWRFDGWVRRALPAVSSARAARRLRVWVEHAVAELEP